MKAAVVAMLLASAAVARAEPKANAVSAQLATLDGHSLGLVGERALGVRKLSLALAIGARSSAQGEYASSSASVGVELRHWVRRPMRGLYLGARTDLGRTTIEDAMEERAIGALTTWTTGVVAGYRFTFRDRVELTPSLGAAMIVEGGLDGRSPTTVRGGGVIGLTLGALF